MYKRQAKGSLLCTRVVDVRSGCVRKKIISHRTNRGDSQTPAEGKKAKKRPRVGRDGYTTQSISRFIGRQSKPNRSGWCLCSLLSVGVVWLSSAFIRSCELVGGVCSSCPLQFFSAVQQNHSLYSSAKEGRKKQLEKATLHDAQRFSPSID